MAVGCVVPIQKFQVGNGLKYVFGWISGLSRGLKPHVIIIEMLPLSLLMTVRISLL